MISLRVFIMIEFIILLGGCVSSGQLTSNDMSFFSTEEMATVYIYRKRDGLIRYAKAPVFKDGNFVGVLNDGSWFRIDISPGDHVIHTRNGYFHDEKSASIKTSFRAGNVYFLRWSWASGDEAMIAGFLSFSDDQFFELIPRDIAATEIVGLDQLVAATGRQRYRRRI